MNPNQMFYERNNAPRFESGKSYNPLASSHALIAQKKEYMQRAGGFVKPQIMMNKHIMKSSQQESAQTHNYDNSRFVTKEAREKKDQHLSGSTNLSRFYSGKFVDADEIAKDRGNTVFTHQSSYMPQGSDLMADGPSPFKTFARGDVTPHEDQPIQRDNYIQHQQQDQMMQAGRGGGGLVEQSTENPSLFSKYLQF